MSNFNKNQMKNMEILDEIKNLLDKNKYKQCKKLHQQNKSDNINISWDEFSKVINELIQSKKRLNTNCNDLKSEVFIARDQLLNEMKIRESIYNENTILKDELNEIKEELREENESARRTYLKYQREKSNGAYQRSRKVKARKEHFKVNESYKKCMITNMNLEIKLENIEKRIKGLTKNTSMNIYKYFKDFFPELEQCPVCCDNYTSDEFCDCLNDKCSVKLCKDCDNMLSYCPYCKQNKKVKCYECHKEFDRLHIYSEGKYVNEKWHCNLCIHDMNSENTSENHNVNENHNDNGSDMEMSTEEDYDSDDDYESDYHDDEYDYIFGANYNQTTNDENVANFNNIFNDSEDEENNNEILL